MSAICRKLIRNADARVGLAGALFDTHFCTQPAMWHAFDGRDLCDEHAEELVTALQQPDNLGSIFGGGPLTEDQARARVWRIQ
jgi:hypothetical protein